MDFFGENGGNVKKILTDFVERVILNKRKEKNFTGGVTVDSAENQEKVTVLSENQNALDRIVELAMLYDFYGALLKENKREIFEEHVLNDLSFSEIAREHGISRQAVYDLMKRCSKELEDYEAKLHLIEKFNHTKVTLQNISTIAKEMKENSKIEQLDLIVELANQLLY